MPAGRSRRSRRPRSRRSAPERQTSPRRKPAGHAEAAAQTDPGRAEGDRRARFWSPSSSSSPRCSAAAARTSSTKSPRPRRPSAAGSSPEEKQTPSAEAAEELGYPSFATNNTTRVGGSDPATNAAGVALAVFPSAKVAQRPAAVTLVDEDDWQGAIAAAVLMAAPVRAPLLVSSGGRPAGPDLAGARRTRPAGQHRHRQSARPSRSAPPRRPTACETTQIKGGGPGGPGGRDRGTARQAASDAPPRHIVLAPEAEPDFAMPAAAWAARSGDPVLFSGADKLPAATAGALQRNPKTPVYVLGPSSAISSERGAGSRQDRQPGAPRLRRGPGRKRDRPGPLRERRLRLERQRPGPRLRRRPQRRAARRRDRRAALRLGHLGTAAAHRRRRYPAESAARIPARRQAGLHHRPDARLLQPRVGDRGPGGHRREPASRNRPAGRTGQDRRRKNERGREPRPARRRPPGHRRGHPRPGGRLHPPLRAAGPQPDPPPDRAAAGRPPGAARRRAQDRRARGARRAQRRPARDDGDRPRIEEPRPGRLAAEGVPRRRRSTSTWPRTS